MLFCEQKKNEEKEKPYVWRWGWRGAEVEYYGHGNGIWSPLYVVSLPTLTGFYHFIDSPGQWGSGAVAHNRDIYITYLAFAGMGPYSYFLIQVMCLDMDENVWKISCWNLPIVFSISDKDS